MVDIIQAQMQKAANMTSSVKETPRRMAPGADASRGTSETTSIKGGSSHATDLETGTGLGHYADPIAFKLKPARSGECKITISGSKDSRVFTYTPSIGHDDDGWKSAPLVASHYDVACEPGVPSKLLRVLKSSSWSGQRMGIYHNVNINDLVHNDRDWLTLTVEVAGVRDTFFLSSSCGRRCYGDPDTYWFSITEVERGRFINTVQALQKDGDGWKVTVKRYGQEPRDIVVESDATWATVGLKLEPDNEEFTVAVKNREDKRLGLRISTQLIITEVLEDGLIAEWNANNLSSRVKLGHSLVSANGVGGSLEAVGAILGQAEEVELQFSARTEDVTKSVFETSGGQILFPDQKLSDSSDSGL